MNSRKAYSPFIKNTKSALAAMAFMDACISVDVFSLPNTWPGITKKVLLIEIDIAAIRYAVAFHDAGREGNGFDLWENGSAERCYRYLSQQQKVQDFIEKAHYTGELIKKDGSWDLNKRIVHDADVLDIMRPCCGHDGIGGFQPLF